LHFLKDRVADEFGHSARDDAPAFTFGMGFDRCDHPIAAHECPPLMQRKSGAMDAI